MPTPHRRRWFGQRSMTLLLFAVGLLLLCAPALAWKYGYDIGYANIATVVVGVALMFCAPLLARYLSKTDR
jgi:membrane-bound ClpP family serine protease